MSRLLLSEVRASLTVEAMMPRQLIENFRGLTRNDNDPRCSYRAVFGPLLARQLCVTLLFIGRASVSKSLLSTAAHKKVPLKKVKTDLARLLVSSSLSEQVEGHAPRSPLRNEIASL